LAQPCYLPEDYTGHKRERVKKEKTVIEVLRRHVCQISAEDVRHESYPEEIGVPNSERPCDATWQGRHERYAVEHTSIDSFHGQRHDDDRFRKLMGKLEKEWSDHPDDWLEIVIDVAAIPNRVNWSDLVHQIKGWLIQNVPSLPCDCLSPVRIPGVPFEISISRQRLPRQGRVCVLRRSSADLSEQRAAIIRGALDKKIGVLRQYKKKGHSTVLLIESSDFVLSSRDTIFKALREAYRTKTDSTVFDQIYIAMTGTSPWCIVPFKVGKEIKKEPRPYWPTAPGYPFGAS
jgi:hypothetical protein